MTSKPKPPAGLGPAGKKLWSDLSAVFDLDAPELPLLAAAARQADDIARLEEAIARDGVTVEGSAGQPRLNGAVSEVRQGRLALAKILGSVAWPTDEKPMTVTQRKARDAARARWARHG